jgi:hypothetical protein
MGAMRIATVKLGNFAVVNARQKRGAWRAAMRISAGIVFSAMYLAIYGTSHAADSDMGFTYGVSGKVTDYGGHPCSVGAPFWVPPAATADELPWRFVWLGHFSGGRPYKDVTGLTLIDWLDEKVCFPSRRPCQDWIARLRRAYHRPEGYWTCLLLR